MGKPRKELTPAAIDALSSYPFPGNIRELENVLERAMIYCEGDMIETVDLDLHGLPSRLALASVAPAGASGSAPGKGRSGDILSDKVEPLEELERRAIIQALAKWKGNRTRASEELGISRRTILNKIKRYGL
jgi:two-component system response regulator AtoC